MSETTFHLPRIDLAAIEASTARAAAIAKELRGDRPSPISRIAWRVARWYAEHGTRPTYDEIESAITRELAQADALDDMGEVSCECGWTGNRDECDERVPRNGKGYGHTPDDVVANCPKCGSEIEEAA